MAKKSYNYAQLEAVAQEMRANADMVFFYEYQTPTATLPTGEVLDLAKEFGEHRTSGRGWPIDEQWIVGVAIGAAAAGSKAVARIPSMAPIYAIEYVQNQAGKIRSMTGGQASMPFVLWQDGAGRSRGSAGQHTDVGMEALYAQLPGIKVVAPSDAYDAKGLMIASIRDPDPVVYLDYSEVKGGEQPDVPDEAYEVPLGKAVVRQQGNRTDDRGLGAGDRRREACAAGAGQGRHQRRVHRSPHAEAARRRHAGRVGPQDAAAARRRARPLHRRLRIARHRGGRAGGARREGQEAGLPRRAGSGRRRDDALAAAGRAEDRGRRRPDDARVVQTTKDTEDTKLMLLLCVLCGR